jgi:hypothetical protein
LREETLHRSNNHFVLLAAAFLAFTIAAAITSLYWLLILPFGFLLFYAGWRQEQIIFYLLIFSLPWSIEYNFNSSLSTDLPDEPIMWLITVLFFAYFLFKPTEIFSRIKHPLIVLLLCALVWIMVTVLFSTDWIISLKFFLAKCWYLVAFVLAPLLFFANKRTISTAAILFLISMVSVTVISVCRHAFYGSGLPTSTMRSVLFPQSCKLFRHACLYSARSVRDLPVK